MKVALRAQSGFTLLEMLVVLTIIAVLTAVATPALRAPSDKVRLEASLREMSAGMRLTRARAIARNAEQDFQIDLQSKTYFAPSIPNTALPSEARIDLTVASSQRNGIAYGTVRFYPDGGSSGAEIRVALGQQSKSISVNWLTGAAEIVR